MWSCLLLQYFFHSGILQCCLLCNTWESIKPSYKKFASRPGLEQLIQVLETSSTGRAKCHLRSGLPYFTALDNLSKAAVALTKVFLQPLLSSILQQQMLTWVERPTCSCSHSVAIECMHALFSFLAPTSIIMFTYTDMYTSFNSLFCIQLHQLLLPVRGSGNEIKDLLVHYHPPQSH